MGKEFLTDKLKGVLGKQSNEELNSTDIVKIVKEQLSNYEYPAEISDTTRYLSKEEEEKARTWIDNLEKGYRS